MVTLGAATDTFAVSGTRHTFRLAEGGTMSAESHVPSESELWEGTQSTDARERANAFFHLSEAATRREEWLAAAALKAEEARILRDLGDPDFAIALTMQAMATCSAGQPDEALRIFDDALVDSRTSLSENILGEITSSKAELLEELGRSDEAIQHLTSARELFRSCGNLGRSGAVSVDAATIHARAWRFSEAQQCYENALTDFQEDHRSLQFAWARDLLASVLEAQGQCERAYELVLANIELYAFHEDEDQVMYGRYRLGWCLMAMGRGDEALQHISAARDHYRATKNMVDRVGIEAHYIDVLRAVGLCDEADVAARQLRAYYESVGDERRLIVTEINLAKWALAKGDDQFGESTLWSAIERAERIGFISQERIGRLVLAQYFVSNDAFHQASSVLSPVQPHDWAENYSRRAAHLNTAAQIAVGLNETSHGLDLAQKALQLSDLRDLTEEGALSRLIVADIEQARGDVAQALSYRAQAVALYLGAGRDNEARQAARLLLPSGSEQFSITTFNESSAIAQSALFTDSSALEMSSEAATPEWMQKAGWVERD